MTLSAQDRQWLQRTAPGAVRFNEPMARHTTLRVGGPADALVRPRDEAQLRALVTGAVRRGLPLLVVGRGSNLLVRDGGIEGMVIDLSAGLHAIALQGAPEAGGLQRVSAQAGARLAALCRFALSRGLDGLVFAVGIPGSVGGAVAVNAGTAEGSMADALAAVTVLAADGRIHRLAAGALRFGYRRMDLPASVAGAGRRPAVIVSAQFRLRPSDAAALRSRARRLMLERRRKQPLARPSAGSFFKNPPGARPAGCLIEAAGLKGRRVGDAAVSRKHANFIVNRGRATAANVLALMAEVQQRVYARFGVRLEPEVRIVGRARQVVS